MTRQTAAARARLYRLRKAGKLPPLPQCRECHRKMQGIHEDLCGYCWRTVSPEGRAHQLALAKAKARRRAYRQWQPSPDHGQNPQ